MLTPVWPSEVWLGPRRVTLGTALVGEAGVESLSAKERTLVRPGATSKRVAELVAGRIAARRALTDWRIRSPEILALQQGDQSGRPYVLAHPSLSVSISHAEGHAVAAASEGSALGVDLEWLARELSPPFLEEAFAPMELEKLGRLRVVREARAAAPVVAWALKEALLKVWGVGLRAPVSLVALVPQGERPLGTGFQVGFQIQAQPFSRPMPPMPTRLEAYVQVDPSGWVLAVMN